jgi:hypothetical protein
LRLHDAGSDRSQRCGPLRGCVALVRSTKKGASTRPGLRFRAGNALPAGFATSRLTRARSGATTSGRPACGRSVRRWRRRLSSIRACRPGHRPSQGLACRSPRVAESLARPQGADIRQHPHPSDMPHRAPIAGAAVAAARVDRDGYSSGTLEWSGSTRDPALSAALYRPE